MAGPTANPVLPHLLLPKFVVLPYSLSSPLVASPITCAPPPACLPLIQVRVPGARPRAGESECAAWTGHQGHAGRRVPAAGFLLRRCPHQPLPLPAWYARVSGGVRVRAGDARLGRGRGIGRGALPSPARARSHRVDFVGKRRRIVQFASCSCWPTASLCTACATSIGRPSKSGSTPLSTSS